VIRFYIAIDRHLAGPYDLNTFKDINVTGDLNFDNSVCQESIPK
jgi:hypothetical protein